MPDLHELPPNGPAFKRRYYFEIIFFTALVIGNLGVLFSAWQDASWGALWLAFIGGPTLNAALMVLGLFVSLFMRRYGKRRLSSGLLFVIICLPIAAMVVDAVVILMMPLHGC